MEKFKYLAISQQKEENQSEEVTDIRYPSVRTKDLNDGRVKVEIFIPSLETGIDKFTPKRGKVKFDFMNSGYGFDMKAIMKDTANKKRTIYKFKVKQLPGRIDMTESKWDVKKGKIVIMMEKHPEERNVDWKNAVFARGLDQASSSSSSSSDTDDA